MTQTSLFWLIALAIFLPTMTFAETSSPREVSSSGSNVDPATLPTLIVRQRVDGKGSPEARAVANDFRARTGQDLQTAFDNGSAPPAGVELRRNTRTEFSTQYGYGGYYYPYYPVHYYRICTSWQLYTWSDGYYTYSQWRPYTYYC